MATQGQGINTNVSDTSNDQEISKFNLSEHSVSSRSDHHEDNTAVLDKFFADNEEDMALNLGFSGFRRGSYDFYKSDWKYLNDFATRGSINSFDTVNKIRGVFVPAGVSSVYDQTLGKNLKRPFLHVRYRSSATDDRKLKTWVTGSVGSATYTGEDVMEVHYLSERCLVVQGANNFVLLKES